QDFLLRERQCVISERLRLNGRVLATELALEFGVPKLYDVASVRFLGENSPASELAVTGENGRIGIVLDDKAFAMRDRQDAMGGRSAEFLRGCS
ncbi:hypothetical protein ACC687_38190, partial [Rhizobium ruizarguesonis]